MRRKHGASSQAKLTYHRLARAFGGHTHNRSALRLTPHERRPMALAAPLTIKMTLRRTRRFFSSNLCPTSTIDALRRLMRDRRFEVVVERRTTHAPCAGVGLRSPGEASFAVGCAHASRAATAWRLRVGARRARMSDYSTTAPLDGPVGRHRYDDEPTPRTTRTRSGGHA